MNPDQMAKMLSSIQSVEAPEPVLTENLQEVVDYIESAHRLHVTLFGVHRTVKKVTEVGVINTCLQCGEADPCWTTQYLKKMLDQFPPTQKMCSRCEARGGIRIGDSDVFEECPKCKGEGWVIA